LSIFSILDSLSRQSPYAPANEDAVGFTGSAAWVIDGATGISDREPFVTGTTDAAWLAAKLNRKFRRGFSKPNVDPNAILNTVQSEIEAEHHLLDAAAQKPASEQPSASFSLAVLTEETLYFMGIGDCRIIFERRDGSIQEFDASNIADAETSIIEERLRVLKTYPGEDPWPRLKPFIRSLREHTNTPGGYSVVHPTRSWIHLLKIATLLHAEVRHVLVVSDGLYRLVNVFNAFDPVGLLKEILSNGIEHLCDRLRGLETNDAACTRFPRVKVSDDASGVLARIDKA
jgi:serine/threonine protein phosphatase PrpC